MDKKKISETLKLVKEFSKPRNFKQSVDLIINLKELNLKKPEDNIDLFVALPHPFAKNLKICAFADKSSKDIAKIFDKVISEDDFLVFKDKKKLKQLVKEYDYFVAQTNLMGKVATIFGKVLGPKGKMPNPKAGCVFPPNADLNIIKSKLEQIVRLRTKNEKIVKVCVGKDDMKEEDLIENIIFVYNSLIHALPKESHNIKNVYLKFTMGISMLVGETRKDIEERMKLKESPRKSKKTAKVEENKWKPMFQKKRRKK